MPLVAATPSPRRTRIAVLICAAAYLYPVPYFPQVNNPNENVRFYMTAAIVEHGTYAIDALRERWGWTNDTATRDGHYYSVKAPGTSLMGVPAYALYHYGTRWFGVQRDRATALWFCRLGGSVLPMLLFLWFFYPWLGKRTGSAIVRDSLFLTVALGSLLYAYALLFVSHTTSALCAFGAFMLLYEARRSVSVSWRRAALAGLLAAGTTALEYPGLVATVALCVYAGLSIRPRRMLAAFCAGAAVPTLLVMHFQWSAFGNALTPGHHLLENAAYRELAAEGFFGASSFSWEAAGGLWFDPGYGLFVLTPLLLFGFPGAARLVADRRKRIDALVALSIALGTFTVICFMNNWRGGWTLGPRYLALTVPFWAWLAAAGLAWPARRWPRPTGAIALGLTGAAFVASGIGSAYYPHIPPAITRPLAQLFSVLISHGYAPHNAGNLLGWWGTTSMLPLGALALVALGWASAHGGERTRQRFAIFGAAALVAALWVTPLWWSPQQSPRAQAAVAFVATHWEPEGKDLAARIERHIAESGAVGPADYERLAATYEAEHRLREAAQVRRMAAHPSGTRPAP